jgi:histidinol-phosphate transaminase
MSRFFSKRYSSLVPYTPGEQPKELQYIKLNTNESPFPPSNTVIQAVKTEAGNLQLYSDPDSTELVNKLAETYNVSPEQVIVNNGSDETLNFAFMAFADEKHPLAFPDITYGFYPVFAELNHIPYSTIPLNGKLEINPDDFVGIGKTIVIANPNAPTGLSLTINEVEKITKSNPNNIVIIDEAYVDFGGESAIPLVDKYENLLVVQTFSKSRSLAGARLGYGIGSKNLIEDLNTIKYSTNPYNVNRMTSAAGIAALNDSVYYQNNCAEIAKVREFTITELRKLDFHVTDSKANFVFAKSNDISGIHLYTELKKRGILIRHFDTEKISDYNRITVGTMQQMKILIKEITEILKEAENN